MSAFVERQAIVFWHKPEEKIPPDGLFVIATISGHDGHYTDYVTVWPARNTMRMRAGLSRGLIRMSREHGSRCMHGVIWNRIKEIEKE